MFFFHFKSIIQPSPALRLKTQKRPLSRPPPTRAAPRAEPHAPPPWDDAAGAAGHAAVDVPAALCGAAVPAALVAAALGSPKASVTPGRVVRGV